VSISGSTFIKKAGTMVWNVFAVINGSKKTKRSTGTISGTIAGTILKNRD
jgi:hypothetical protein